MESQYYWELFMATGAPSFYLKYQACLRTEDKDVSENTGSCASPDGTALPTAGFEEGCIMDSDYYWELFMATGAPGFYLKYQACLRSEDKDVSENSGPCAPADGVQ